MPDSWLLCYPERKNWYLAPKYLIPVNSILYSVQVPTSRQNCSQSLACDFFHFLFPARFPNIHHSIGKYFDVVIHNFLPHNITFTKSLHNWQQAKNWRKDHLSFRWLSTGSFNAKIWKCTAYFLAAVAPIFAGCKSCLRSDWSIHEPYYSVLIGHSHLLVWFSIT